MSSSSAVSLPNASITTRQYDTTHSEAAEASKASPMIQQFLAVKREHPNTLLFYRMGDFYETFLEDALTAARALEITLTGRDAGGLGKIPMAGVPVRAVDTYLNRLLAQQYKVAICEQMEDPAEAKGLVERRVVRVLSSGTVTESAQVPSEQAPYLAAVWIPPVVGEDEPETLPAKAHTVSGCALAYVDVTTGVFCTCALSYGQLLSELDRLQPSEVLVLGVQRKGLGGFGVNEWVPAVPEAIRSHYACTPLAASDFDSKVAEQRLCELLQVETLDGYGLNGSVRAETAVLLKVCGAIAAYLKNTFMEQTPTLNGLNVLNLSEHVLLTAGTRSHLELLSTARSGEQQGSLFGVLNQTVTSMGARLLKQWLNHPLRIKFLLEERLDGVEALVQQGELREQLRQVLPHIYDVERLAHRLASGTVLPRELLALAQSLEPLPMLSQWLNGAQTEFQNGKALLQPLLELPPAVFTLPQVLRQALKDPAPQGVKEGNLIASGYNEELDHLHSVLGSQEEWLRRFEAEERERSGIKNLKVSYSRAFGYYIELSKGAAAGASASYTRKQTLTNAERFITPELKQFENEVLQAQARTVELETELFLQLRLALKPLATSLKPVAEALARLDVLQSLAEVAVRYDYTRPELLENSTVLELEASRHPVVERQRPAGRFVANPCQLKGYDPELNDGFSAHPQVLVITGPNMAGKSTYMRQVAVLVVMAQMGSFVPAGQAKIGLIDALYTRIGAVDDLSGGQSTFMVEMAETAQMLNGATRHSLLVLDEVGRGTSTYDGVAIAWSVLDYLVQHIGCRTLFATHYHELNVLELMYPGQILNVRMCVSEQPNQQLCFLHRVEPGSAQKSYGIQVAKMAGLPAEVLQMADRKLSDLQKEAERHMKSRRLSLAGEGNEQVQLSLL